MVKKKGRAKLRAIHKALRVLLGSRCFPNVTCIPAKSEREEEGSGCHFGFREDDAFAPCSLLLSDAACAAESNLVRKPVRWRRYKRAPEMWRAVIGLHHLFKHRIYTIKSRVKAIKMHYYYDTEKYRNDIALFQLSKSITYSDYIQPICLPDSTLVLTSDMKCYITGWGMKKEKGKASYTLQEAQLKLFPLNICNQYSWYAGTVSSTTFCAGSETGAVDSCQGDSGGPLVCYLSDSKYYLIGITSYGVGCGRPRFPGIYTSLPKYRHWVEKQLSETNTVSIQHILFLTVVWTIFHLVV
ncbi:transmembrane protease serine 12-like [Liasis olivaceus]